MVVLSVIGSLQWFELPWVLLDNTAGPDDRGLTVVMYLYLTCFLVGDLGYASSIGWVLGVILALAAAVQIRVARTEEPEGESHDNGRDDRGPEPRAEHDGDDSDEHDDHGR